ncbi:MAG: leucine-rich repeat protein [Bacteroidaceae bacterium]|nr:leucine-rich repeat protein [Bacteroidaceae bacterium]
MKTISHKRARKPINENQRITMSLKQLRRLVNEGYDEESDGIFDIVDCVLVDYLGDEENVVIPDGIEEIASGAFSGTAIKSVTIPDTVSTIGRDAFFNCPNLTEINVSPRLLRIILTDLEYSFDSTPFYEYFRHDNDAIQSKRIQAKLQTDQPE